MEHAAPPTATDEPATPPPQPQPQLTLLDLDPELLLSAIETLCASDQARARGTCKLFAIIVYEIVRTASFMVSAVAPLGSVLEAELRPRLEAPPSLGILFTKDDADDAALGKLARQLPHHLELVGGHMSVVAGTDASGALKQTNSVCPHSRSGPGEVGLSLGHFPEATVKSFAIDGRAAPDWKSQLQAEGALEPGWKVFLVVAQHDNIEDIVDALQAAHPDAAIIGGLATGRRLYRVRHNQAQCFCEGVVGLMFGGNVPLAAFVSRGARGLGAGAFSFGADDLRTFRGGQMLTHVSAPDGGARQTALEAAIDSMNEAGRGAGGLCVGLADAPGEGFELTPLSNRMVVQSEAALLLQPRRGDGAPWEGGALRFYSFDPESCRQDLTRRLDAMRAGAASRGDRLLGAVMFTCGGRTSHFFGEPAFDATTFARIFAGVPLIGMYAGGEIGPPLLADAPPAKAFQTGNACMHGFTAIFGIFIVPERQPRASELAFADEAAVAAAYAELRARAPPVPPPAAAASGSFLPASLAELRKLPVKALKQAMARLGLTLTPGSEKEDLVQAIAPHLHEHDGQ